MVEPRANCRLAMALDADQHGAAESGGPVIRQAASWSAIKMPDTDRVAGELNWRQGYRSRLARVPTETGRNRPTVKKAGAGGIAGGSTRQRYHPCLPKVQKNAVREVYGLVGLHCSLACRILLIRLTPVPALPLRAPRKPVRIHPLPDTGRWPD